MSKKGSVTNSTMGKSDLCNLCNKKPVTNAYWYDDCMSFGIWGSIVKNVLIFIMRHDTHDTSAKGGAKMYDL